MTALAQPLPRPTHLIDAHVHLMDPARTASGIRWIRRVVPDYAALDERVTAAELLDHLGASGVEAVWSFFYPLRPGESARINRWQRELASAYPPAGPSRPAAAGSPAVAAFASVHAGDDDPGGIVEEALGRLDLAGLKLHPYVQKLDPLDPGLRPALAATQESGRPLVIHTGFAEFYGSDSLRDAVFELAARYPKLRIVTAHLLYPDLPIGDWPGWLDRHPNLYLDATNVLSVVRRGTPDWDALTALLDGWSHRFTFGSDYPMGMAYPVGKLYPLARAIAPNLRALEDLCWRTAAGLLERRRLPAGMARDL